MTENVEFFKLEKVEQDDYLSALENPNSSRFVNVEAEVVVELVDSSQTES